jgi:hypothetical protein
VVRNFFSSIRFWATATLLGGGTYDAVLGERSEGFGRYILEFCGDAGAGGPELTQRITVKVICSHMPVGYAA